VTIEKQEEMTRARSPHFQRDFSGVGVSLALQFSDRSERAAFELQREMDASQYLALGSSSSAPLQVLQRNWRET
jgi:hypothetical protein